MTSIPQVSPTRKPPGPKPRPLAERFWSHVDKSGGPDACWPWIGSRNEKGYGKFSNGRKQQHLYAHRTAYELTNGPLAPGMFACHSCDNPPCCNPAHLWAGSHADNTADAVAKGLMNRGEHNGSAKLTAAQVQAIRIRLATGQASQHALAREFGVTSAMINRIALHKAWRHL